MVISFWNYWMNILKWNNNGPIITFTKVIMSNPQLELPKEIVLKLLSLCPRWMHYALLFVSKDVSKLVGKVKDLDAFGESVIITNSINGGYLNLLIWARSKNRFRNDDTCVMAIRKGHFELLKWAYEKDACSLGGYRACDSAACGGYFDILKWLRDRECEWGSWTCTSAAIGGHLEILKWCRDNGCPWIV